MFNLHFLMTQIASFLRYMSKSLEYLPSVPHFIIFQYSSHVILSVTSFINILYWWFLSHFPNDVFRDKEVLSFMQFIISIFIVRAVCPFAWFPQPKLIMILTWSLLESTQPYLSLSDLLEVNERMSKEICLFESERTSCINSFF